jgi:hypothetical protein
MDAQDQACIAHALEFAETGQRVSWRDPGSGRDYTVTLAAWNASRMVATVAPTIS